MSAFNEITGRKYTDADIDTHLPKHSAMELLEEKKELIE